MKIIKTKPNIKSRALAALIDYAVIASYVTVMFILFGVKKEVSDIANPIVKVDVTAGDIEITGLPALSIIAFWFIYFIGSEQYFGRTLGNYAVYLKPISIHDRERELSFGQSMKRHIFDWLDIGLAGIIPYITIKNSNYNQRLGDIWAHTIVVDTTDSEQGIFYE